MTTIHLSNGHGVLRRNFETLQHALFWLSQGRRAQRLLAIITQGEE
jgi:hypothetical protein